jgi:hypothetical protein
MKIVVFCAKVFIKRTTKLRGHLLKFSICSNSIQRSPQVQVPALDLEEKGKLALPERDVKVSGQVLEQI